MKTENASLAGHLAREVERERHERKMNDELKAGLSPEVDSRLKDARENTSATCLKRSTSR
jgi:hypothetical protein